MSIKLNDTAKNSFRRRIQYAGLSLQQRISKFLRKFQAIDQKLIIFESFGARAYADSPRALYESMLSDPRFKNFKFIWVQREPDKYAHLAQSPRTKVVAFDSHEYFAGYRRAKYWVVNTMLPLGIAKGKGQIMLQCFHGTPLKRLRNDIIENTEATLESAEDHRIRNNLDTKRYDYFISPSRYATGCFMSAFSLVELGLEHIIIETGYPRNDYLTKYTKDDVARLKRDLNIATDKKVALYAPTWRDDQFDPSKGYMFEPRLDFEALQSTLGSDYVLLFRLHYNVADTFDFANYQGFIYDVSNIDSINDLYVISDVLITDYSSVLFDFANLRRPMIFYMYDQEHYEKALRGFYLPPSTLPGDIVNTQTELTNRLQDLETYHKRTRPALEDFHSTYNYLDDGQATGRVIDAVFNVGVAEK